MRAPLPGAVAGGVVLALVGYGAYRSTQPSAREMAANAAFVRDRSDSTTSGCSAIGGLAGEFLRSGQAGRFSTIVALATGDRRSNDEPVEFARISQARRSSVRDGHNSAGRRDAALVGELVSRCEDVGHTERSPIYLAIRRALEELRALGCREKSHCALYVQSDLEENAEPGLKEALLGRGDAPLPTKLDNQGIRVRACGPAETLGPIDGGRRGGGRRNVRSAKRAEIVPEIWRRMFASPDLVSFEPLCPKAAASAGGDARAGAAGG